MQVDTDGAPDAYHPDDIGITHICNGVNVNAGGAWESDCLTKFNKAKAEGFQGATKIDFFAMATRPNGTPIIQGSSDPKPGYFVSTTSFKQPRINGKTPQAQLDSNTIPYIVIPSTWQRSSAPGVKLGDFAVILRKSTGKISYAVVGDTGPNSKLGEGSVALHEALGNNPFMMRYGKRRAMKGIGSRDVLYVVFPNSHKNGEVVTNQLINMEGTKLLEEFGGTQRLLKCSR
ncbi:MAG TPA: glycoside hydrolase family 75 protein [Candidatus Thiothrix moscowensis]|mgnify:CR=1 FL=1|uniref:glycoside hydrolase family 75 protein n=1 Tax=Thiothrix sp. UBA2016 TaxID=1947695 RepID=UPI0025FC9532|nr:glycoside hydrolase family 75 protein [Thiothrix sp. UBA2016]HRJ53065.1 glycoside hydrolase family 75 protein [Candidatus Thiothrix moscowensis]HRJ93056.1 glycoside hydrolase family 75 protein [Candidatus Thiothrix moscowensis]